MNPEELQAFKEQIRQEIMTEVNTSLNGLSAKLNRELPKTILSQIGDNSPAATQETKQAKTSPENLATAALKAEIDKLKADLEAKEKSNKDLSRRNLLAKYLTNTLNPEAAVKLLDGVISEKAEEGEDGNWYVRDNETAIKLSDYVDNYLKTDGSWLKKGTAAQPLDIKTESKQSTTTSSKPKSLTEIIQKNLEKGI